MPNHQKSEAIKLLWTGGWDSTFRLLQILLLEKRTVKLYYVVDPTRNSTGVEIQFRKMLKREICTRYPHTKQLFRPTIYINIESIEPDDEIQKAYLDLKKHVPLGNQHEWLPQFCKQHQIFGMEMSTENGSTPEELWANVRFLINHFSDDPDTLSEHEYSLYKTSKTLYKYFRFPVIQYSKQDMLAEAEKNDWLPILTKTWFCYQPIYIPLKGYVACGNCVTCKYLIRIDFGWRIPFYSRWFQNLRKFTNKIAWPVLKKLSLIGKLSHPLFKKFRVSGIGKRFI